MDGIIYIGQSSDKISLPDAAHTTTEGDCVAVDAVPHRFAVYNENYGVDPGIDEQNLTAIEAASLALQNDGSDYRIEWYDCMDAWTIYRLSANGSGRYASRFFSTERDRDLAEFDILSQVVDAGGFDSMQIVSQNEYDRMVEEWRAECATESG